MFYLSGSLIRAALNNTLTCFLIDDDIDDHEIFSTVLGVIAPASNCVVTVNGQAALEMLISGLFSPDVIFLDLNMPLMNGRQFLQEVNRLRILQDVPIVVLTTSADANTKAAMLEAGAKDFITKPDRFSQWEQVLRRALGNYL